MFYFKFKLDVQYLRTIGLFAPYHYLLRFTLQKKRSSTSRSSSNSSIAEQQQL